MSKKNLQNKTRSQYDWKLDVKYDQHSQNFTLVSIKLLCVYFCVKISNIGICIFIKIKKKNEWPKVHEISYLSIILRSTHIFQHLDSLMLVLLENGCFQGRRLSPCIYPMLLASLTNLFQKYNNTNRELSVKTCRFQILNVNKVVYNE